MIKCRPLSGLLFGLMGILMAADAAGLAQSADSRMPEPALSSGSEIPSLEILIAAAIEHSPLLAGQEGVIALAQIKRETASRHWLEYITLASDLRYGTDDFVYLDRETAGYDLYAKPYETTRYNLGIRLDLSLFDLATRRQFNQSARIDVEMAHARKQELLQAVRNAVITQYYQLVLAQKTLEIMALQKTSSDLQAQMAELQFEKQSMDFIEYSKILEFHTKTLLDFEKAAAEFQKNKSLMQELTGLSLKQ
jgi:outer membrane protein TolC